MFVSVCVLHPHTLQEVEGLGKAGVVFYGINLSVGLSVAIPGFASDMAHGLLGEMPFGTISIVGVKVRGVGGAREECRGSQVELQ